MFADKNRNEDSRPSFWQRLQQGLAKTRNGLFKDLGSLINQSHKLDHELLEEIEARLLLADVGVDSTLQLIEALQKAIKTNPVSSADQVFEILHKQMVAMLEPVECPLVFPHSPKPFTILMVGVNGAGKTTTIGKLANLFNDNGMNVVLAAGDTFRAAAIEQLNAWGEKNKIPVISHPQGSDVAAVIFDGLQVATKNNTDILIADTAGRLHNKSNLMEELKKIRRTMTKFDPEMPVEVMLTLDSSSGQNALTQAIQFHDAIGITGIVLTKLDGSAKGGIIFSLAAKLGIPIRYIAAGEQMTDLNPFKAKPFVNALLGREL